MPYNEFMKKELGFLVGLGFVCTSARADIGFFGGLSPFASSASNPGGYAADVGIDYSRDNFRIEMLTLGLSSSYESADSVDWIASSSLQVQLTKEIFGGVRTGLQFIDSSPSVTPSVRGFASLTATAMAPSGMMIGLDVGLQSQFTKLLLGYHF